jgi:hypothetical protein
LSECDESLRPLAYETDPRRFAWLGNAAACGRSESFLVPIEFLLRPFEITVGDSSLASLVLRARSLGFGMYKLLRLAPFPSFGVATNDFFSPVCGRVVADVTYQSDGATPKVISSTFVSSSIPSRPTAPVSMELLL